MTVVFQLLGGMGERLTRGESVEVRISTVRIIATMLRAIGTWLLGATMLLNPLDFRSVAICFAKEDCCYNNP